jgi:hypothetical protein
MSQVTYYYRCPICAAWKLIRVGSDELYVVPSCDRCLNWMAKVEDDAKPYVEGETNG